MLQFRSQKPAVSRRKNEENSNAGHYEREPMKEEKDERIDQQCRAYTTPLKKDFV